jgi:uncharacterized protein (TIGR03435 family)
VVYSKNGVTDAELNGFDMEPESDICSANMKAQKHVLFFRQVWRGKLLQLTAALVWVFVQAIAPHKNAGQNLTSAPARTQSAQPELLLFHPAGRLPSYEVATIKLIDPDAASSQVKLPPGTSLSPLSIRRYIMNAYGAIYQAEVVGGPDWLNKDAYKVNGKVPEDISVALEKMNRDDRIDQTRRMQQSLLADRFHLKAHFETRVLPVYELVPAKRGLKIAAVPAPPNSKPGDTPPVPRPGDPLPAGTLMTIFNSKGLRVLQGHAIRMDVLARTLGAQMGDRPVVDHTGFIGYFDVAGITWAPLGDALATGEPDAPALTTALEEELGLRLVPGKDPIEVLVIDSIERPTAD